MIDIIKKNECTGCKMCQDICPVNAINFIADNEGFWYPIVNYKACVKCGLCLKRCPPLSDFTYNKFNYTEPKVFASWTLDEDLRINSTSGGIYGELANKVFSNNGNVAGVIYDDDFLSKHIISNDKQDWKKLIRSKYFQSDTDNIFEKVKNKLINGEEVLFSGNPCQVAGLLSFLNKDYSNLYTSDFICRGNLSPKAFIKYKKMLEVQYNSKVKEIYFKSKTIGWNDFGTKVVFENEQEYFKGRNEDLYVLAYIHYNLFLRPCCLECKFKKIPRVADITLGDFWEVSTNVDESLDDNKGTSAVIINSEKGEKLFNSIKDTLYIKETDIESVNKGNSCLFESAKKGENRDIVFKNIDKYPFDKLIDKYCKKNIKQRMLSIVYYIVPKIKNLLGCD